MSDVTFLQGVVNSHLDRSIHPQALKPDYTNPNTLFSAQANPQETLKNLLGVGAISTNTQQSFGVGSSAATSAQMIPVTTVQPEHTDLTIIEVLPESSGYQAQ